MTDPALPTAPAARTPPPDRPGPRKEAARKVKLLKRIERNLTALFKLGRTEWFAKHAYQKAETTEHRAGHLQDDIAGLRRDLAALRAAVSSLEDAQRENDHRFDIGREAGKAGLAVLSRTVGDLSRRFDHLMLHRDLLDMPAAAAADPQPGPPVPDGFRTFLDSFYHRLENRYRGPRDEIANRLRVYLPDVEAAVLRTGGKPAMDMGCGRGEWLGLLAETGIEAYGVDTNPVQTAEAQGQGLDIRLGDALAHLAEAPDHSLAAITAHHLVEHLPFERVAWIAREACRVLAPGGILLFETPNTRNVLVGATTFHTDPTHLKPMPEQVLGPLFETAGFHPVEIRPLNPHARLGEFLAMPDMNDELAMLLFGPQDLAVLGMVPFGD